MIAASVNAKVLRERWRGLTRNEERMNEETKKMAHRINVLFESGDFVSIKELVDAIEKLPAQSEQTCLCIPVPNSKNMIWDSNCPEHQHIFDA